MKVKSGSDWLLSQEALARRKIAELQRVPPSRTVTETRSVRVPAPDTPNYKLLFWTGPLFFLISIISFLLFLFSDNAIISILALPIAAPVFSFINFIIGGELTSSWFLSIEMVLAFDIFFNVGVFIFVRYGLHP